MAVTDDAIEKIKQMIITGRFGPGQRLPREADLAAELGLSRSSLREAVRALSLVNVLEVRRGDGTYATSLEPSLLMETMSFVTEFSRDDAVLQFLEVRRVLEPAATALAATRMPEADLAELAAGLGCTGAETTVEQFAEADVEFHRKIASGSGNPILASLAESIPIPTVRTRIWRRVTEPGMLQRVQDEHRAIYGAIARRDPDLARSWATAHIAGIESRLRAAFSADRLGYARNRRSATDLLRTEATAPVPFAGHAASCLVTFFPDRVVRQCCPRDRREPDRERDAHRGRRARRGQHRAVPEPAGRRGRAPCRAS